MESKVFNQAASDGFSVRLVRPGARQRAVEFLEDLFPQVSRRGIQDLAQHVEWVHVSGGESLILQGELASCVYLVVSGRLRIHAHAAREVHAVAYDVGRGGVVGEVALLTGERHAATISAVRDSELLRISKEAFERFVEMDPAAMKQVVRAALLGLRPKVTSADREGTATTIAIVPAGDDAPLSQFARRLARALSAAGPTVHLDKDALDRAIAHSPRCPGSATAWLHEQESKCRFVVYESDGTWSPWTQRCVRQADCVIAVGVANGDPRLSAVEAEIAVRLNVPMHLVLLHGDDTDKPLGTHAWLSGRRVALHHHVRVGCDAHYERVARVVSGRAVAVVLGGGGARGMAHIGALRAIQELGIPIDLIGGTSIGAAIAGAAASGFSCDRMVQIAQQRLLASRSLLDYTLPFVSLASGRRMSESLQQTFHDLRIEDLWLN
jgi:CRP-like cAMP-binding protein